MICPVILSGGSGTRLWPVSRRQHPKQFVPLAGEEPLFTATLRRVSDRSRYAAPVIVGNAEHKFFILEALDQLGIADAVVLLEPLGRNTAAAAIIAALHAAEVNADALHLVLPSDHLVADEGAFHRAVAAAGLAAETGKIALFGIAPSRPETGYGYILPGEAAGGDTLVKNIAHFHEKPNREGADRLIAQGALWNSGMFLYDPAVLREEAARLAPAHYGQCAAAWEQSQPERRCMLLNKEAYEAMESHAFDTLIMEQTAHGVVLPCAMGWSDVGSWQALWELAEKDAAGNALAGPVVAREVTSSYIRSHGPTVAMLGMEDCLVVATKDVVLIAPRERSQEVKALLGLVEDRDADIADHHTYVPRPWGVYENIGRGANFQVKHITVRPGRSLSSQMHHHRAEHWVVVAGTAKVECKQ